MGQLVVGMELCWCPFLCPVSLPAPSPRKAGVAPVPSVTFLITCALSGLAKEKIDNYKVTSQKRQVKLKT